VYVPRDEIARRVVRTQSRLKDVGLNGAVILDPLNFAYLSGFHLDVDTWERPVALAIPADGQAVAVINELSSHAWDLGREEGFVVTPQVTAYREHNQNASKGPPVAKWANLLGETLRAIGISLSIGSDRPAILRTFLRSKGRVADIEPFVREMRRVKSPAELDIFRRSAAITNWAQEQYRAWLRPGHYIQEADHQIATMLEIRAAEEFPKSHIQMMVISYAGSDTAYPHGMCGWPGRKIELGHMLSINLAFRIDGLGAENERVWSVGKPDARFRKVFEVAREAQAVGVSACTAGRPFSEIDRMAQQIIEEAGFGAHSVHRSGHGVGLGLHEYPADTAFNDELMKTNEVMAVEPGIYIRGYGGFRHSDTLIVGSKGPEVLTLFPKDLESLIV
jgi:Xaa-Pro aminopeptidase